MPSSYVKLRNQRLYHSSSISVIAPFLPDSADEDWSRYKRQEEHLLQYHVISLRILLLGYEALFYRIAVCTVILDAVWNVEVIIHLAKISD